MMTKKGPIIGLRHDPNPKTGVSFDVFLGIPYGQIPARFQLAEPRSGWTEPLYTQEPGPICPQPEEEFDEDCLSLNVFIPLNASSRPGSLPVMAYLHGARFTQSSSHPERYGPDFFVNESIVFVSLNFRLGIAGFLTLGSKVAPGNMGLHDTLLALQWIQDEISVFGGDPSQVTLIGYSSGSIMTQMNYLSPLTSRLFARAVAQSGSALADWGHYSPAEGTRRAKALATKVNCDPSQNDTALLACLQAADIKDIVNNHFAEGILSKYDEVSGNNRVFLPVLDSHLTADRPFFNDSLENLMKRAWGRGRPLLTGFDTEEGILKVLEYDYWMEAEDNLEAFIPMKVLPRLNSSERAVLAGEIRDRYLSNDSSRNNVKGLANLYTDAAYAYPSIEVTRYLANITYSYLFAFRGTWAPTKFYVSWERLEGVIHGSEILYLFYNDHDMTQDLTPRASNMANLRMKEQLIRWWTTFIKTGTPGFGWKTVAEAGYLVIDSTLSTINSTEFESRYYDFWADMDDY